MATNYWRQRMDERVVGRHPLILRGWRGLLIELVGLGVAAFLLWPFFKAFCLWAISCT